MKGTQICKPLEGMKELGHKWAGTNPKKENDGTKDDDEITTEKNGTDGKISKGMDEEEEAAMREAEEEEDSCMEKSFFDLCETSDIIMDGVYNSPFLLGVVKSIGLSFEVVEQNISKSLSGVHHDHVDLAKSLDDSFNAMGARLGIIDATGDAVDLNKSQDTDAYARNVVPLNKSGFGEGGKTPSRFEILAALEKSVESGDLAPIELIKFESTGQLSPTLQKSLGL